MALQINVALTDSTGGTVPSGTIVKFRTTFIENTMDVMFALFCYKSQAAFDAGSRPYVPVEISEFNPVYTMSQQDYDSLTPAVVHTKLKEILEAMPGIGADNVAIV